MQKTAVIFFFCLFAGLAYAQSLEIGRLKLVILDRQNEPAAHTILIVADEDGGRELLYTDLYGEAVWTSDTKHCNVFATGLGVLASDTLQLTMSPPNHTRYDTLHIHFALADKEKNYRDPALCDRYNLQLLRERGWINKADKQGKMDGLWLFDCPDDAYFLYHTTVRGSYHHGIRTGRWAYSMSQVSGNGDSILCGRRIYKEPFLLDNRDELLHNWEKDPVVRHDVECWEGRYRDGKKTGPWFYWDYCHCREVYTIVWYEDGVPVHTERHPEVYPD